MSRFFYQPRENRESWPAPVITGLLDMLTEVPVALAGEI